jgi:glycosyltransferase involved in cell wall biosynthesis
LDIRPFNWGGKHDIDSARRSRGDFVQIDSSQEQIAIVVPNYNHGRYLPECLSSIANQTRQPDEVLIIDDGSSDDSVDVISRFLEGRPTWQLIKHPERRGVVKRLNEGLAQVKSTWVTLFGADDFLNPKYVELSAQMASQYPSAGLICGCVEIFGSSGGRKIRPPVLPRTSSGYVSPAGFRELLRIGDNYFVGAATLYRRQAFVEIGGLDEQLGSICDSFAARQIAARHGFGFIPEVLGYWRMHGSNFSVSTVTDPQALDRGIKAVRTALKREPAEAFPPSYGDLLDRRLRFGGARLIAVDRSVAASVRAARIRALLHGGRFEQCVLATFMRAGVLGSIAALAWLTIRLRPFSLSRLLRHIPVRRSILAATKHPMTAIK